jgi:hypothetical protein
MKNIIKNIIDYHLNHHDSDHDLSIFFKALPILALIVNALTIGGIAGLVGFLK